MYRNELTCLKGADMVFMRSFIFIALAGQDGDPACTALANL